MTSDKGITVSGITSLGGSAEPLYFKSGENHLFAWLHHASDSSPRNVGIVICSPFGYESICAHRSVREFANAMAADGIPTLRFDYVGAGDSADSADDADFLSLWTRDVVSAIRELRHRTGVERVCLLGIRLGALLASLAATECQTVDSLILIGPIVSGRRHLRDLRMTQMAGDALSGSSAADGEAEGAAHAPRMLEVGGFSLPPATLQSLAQVDLHKAPAPRVRSILILDNDKLPAARRWADSLSASGMEVAYMALPGLVEMAMTAPQFATVPRSMIDAARQWLNATAKPAISNAPPTKQEAPVPAALLIEDKDSPHSPITERPVCIPAGVTLFGVVTAPRAVEKCRRAVILLNPGADFHIGASRMYVSLARRWARCGFIVLRLDLGGIGDSGTRPGNVDDEVFPVEAINDIRSAIDFIRSQYSIGDIALAGLCSGAYHALRAAAEGADVTRILLVNPQNYFWKKGMTLEQIQLAEVVHNPGLYRRRIFSSEAWRRIFTGEADIKRIGGIYLQRVRLGAELLMWETARRLHIRLPNDLGWDLERIVAKGVRISFVFARGEPGIRLLELQAGSTLSRLGTLCQVRILNSGDHIFSRREPRAIMENVLSEELLARDEGSAVDGPPRSPMLHQVSAK